MPGMTLGRSIREWHSLQRGTEFGEFDGVVDPSLPCIAIPPIYVGSNATLCLSENQRA
jgi:hypothetical protein